MIHRVTCQSEGSTFAIEYEADKSVRGRTFMVTRHDAAGTIRDRFEGVVGDLIRLAIAHRSRSLERMDPEIALTGGPVDLSNCPSPFSYAHHGAEMESRWFHGPREFILNRDRYTVTFPFKLLQAFVNDYIKKP